jgi:hypothetical protein
MGCSARARRRPADRNRRHRQRRADADVPTPAAQADCVRPGRCGRGHRVIDGEAPVRVTWRSWAEAIGRKERRLCRDGGSVGRRTLLDRNRSQDVHSAAGRHGGWRNADRSVCAVGGRSNEQRGHPNGDRSFDEKSSQWMPPFSWPHPGPSPGMCTGERPDQEGRLSVTGPTSTDGGSTHPVAASRAEVKLSGNVTLTWSNGVHSPPPVSTSLQ